MADSERPKWESENWKSTSPPEDLQCKDCIFRLRPITIAGETIDRANYGNCDIYRIPQMKPQDVLWNHGECEYYEKEARLKR